MGRSSFLPPSVLLGISVNWPFFIQGIGELAHLPYENIKLFRTPVLEDYMAHTFARSVNAVRHCLSLRGNDCFAHTPVKGTFPTLHQPQAFKLGHLPADGGVVAS